MLPQASGNVSIFPIQVRETSCIPLPGQYTLLKFYLFDQRKTFPTSITLISKASGLIEIKIAESLAAAARVWLLSGVFQMFTNQPWATYSRPSSPWAARP